MTPLRLISGMLFPTILLFSLPSHAQVYKCKNASQATVYSDQPCANSHVEVITTIPLNNVQADGYDGQPAVMRQLDAAVQTAIANGDLIRARALATTQTHKEWVAAAVKEQANQPAKTEVEIRAELASSQACHNAKRQLETEANASFSNPEVLEARKTLMYSACGIVEPVIVQQQTQPGFVHVYPYGYPHRSRPYGHKQPPYKGQPHRDRWEHGQPTANYKYPYRSGISIQYSNSKSR